MKYNSLIRDHFYSPRNQGPLENANAVGEATNEACLDRLRLFLRVENGIVTAASFQAEGCVPAIAVGSVLSEFVIGKDVGILRGLSPEDIDALLGGLPATKQHAAFLAMETLQKALGGEL
jgi:NifU-like protein involved in Fe-S cluster formation